MQTSTLLLIVLCIAFVGYFFGRRRAFAVARSNGGMSKMHSLPGHYGYMVAVWCALPALALILIWNLFDNSIIEGILHDRLPAPIQQADSQTRGLYMNDINNLIESEQFSLPATDPAYTDKHALAGQMVGYRNLSGILLGLLSLGAIVAGLVYANSRIKSDTPARDIVERVIRVALVACASLAILTTLGIVLSVLFESLRFFQEVGFLEFVAGTRWSPQTAIRADQVGSSGAFGAIPLFVGTLLISFIAMVVAVPLGLMSAIYLAEYASERVRSVAKPLLEVLAGIPTVVYGFFAALTVAPAIRGFGESIGLSVASESALAAGMVMGIMIIPFISSLSDDVITAVPQSMRDGSYGLGATQSETIRKVVLPAALPGIVGSILLAASRAIGETMIVVMAAGLAANLTVNPLEAVTTVTVQIVTLLTGDQEFDSAKTLAAFALGLMLFVVTLILNVVALHVVRKYREQYD
ncbi:MAG: phosphate ABC transporter permease subunit PstC [Gammaproteobacteria bacterium]|nr:phosphate ABC transporter permease subunit PstC [Gammaproteobacteria bacterium]